MIKLDVFHSIYIDLAMSFKILNSAASRPIFVTTHSSTNKYGLNLSNFISKSADAQLYVYLYTLSCMQRKKISWKHIIIFHNVSSVLFPSKIYSIGLVKFSESTHRTCHFDCYDSRCRAAFLVLSYIRDTNFKLSNYGTTPIYTLNVFVSSDVLSEMKFKSLLYSSRIHPSCLY